HCPVVDCRVLEALLAHTFGDQLLGPLDRLDQLSRRKTEFLGAQSRRRLCRRDAWQKQHGECQKASRRGQQLDDRCHQSSTPSTWPVSRSTSTSLSAPARVLISTT